MICCWSIAAWNCWFRALSSESWSFAFLCLLSIFQRLQLQFFRAGTGDGIPCILVSLFFNHQPQQGSKRLRYYWNCLRFSHACCLLICKINTEFFVLYLFSFELALPFCSSPCFTDIYHSVNLSMSDCKNQSGVKTSFSKRRRCGIWVGVEKSKGRQCEPVCKV